MTKNKKKVNVKSVWKCDDMKVVFSEPDIQPWESVVYIKDMKDFLYYYYTMTVYRKYKKKWKKELEAYAYDFPAIRSLEAIFDRLNDNNFTDGTWQIDRLDGKKAVWYRKGYSTSDIVSEDLYRIERCVRIVDGEQSESFSLLIGSGMDNGMDMRSDAAKCVIFDFVSREEITGFMNTVRGFIKKSINKYNNDQRERLAAEQKSCRVENGKLYQYKVEYSNGFWFNEKSLEAVFTIGDAIELEVLGKYEGEDVFIDYKECKIVDIEKSDIGMGGYITIEGGYSTFRHTVEKLGGLRIKIPVELITYIFSRKEMDDEQFKYNEEQCKVDFIKIMDKKEMMEFAETDINELLYKWKSAVAGRTWMYREEHDFKNPEKAVKRVIKEIKKECRKMWQKNI